MYNILVFQKIQEKDMFIEKIVALLIFTRDVNKIIKDVIRVVNKIIGSNIIGQIERDT